MPHADLFCANGNLHWPRQLKESHIIGDGTSVLSETISKFFVGEIAFFNKSLEGNGNLDGVQVFALNVFDQGHFEQRLVVCFPNVCWDFLKIRELRRSKATFATNDLVLVRTNFVDGDGLNDSQLS